MASRPKGRILSRTRSTYRPPSSMSPTRVLACLVLALSFAPRAHAQLASEPFPLPRIGDVIDPHERRYFGLFPDYDGDDTLRVERAGPDSVRVVAVSGGSVRPVAPAFSVEKADALAEMIARYEDLFLALGSPFRPARVAGLVRWRPPFRDVEAWTTVTRRSGPELRGVLLHADEEGLVLSTSSPSFRGFQSADGLVWVRADDVLRVWRAGFRSRLDLRPGGSPDRYARGTLPTLRDEATFVRGLPPELEAWRRARTAERGRSASNAPPPGYARLPLSRWRLAFQFGPGWIDAGSTKTRLFVAGGTVTNGWRGPAAVVRGRVDYAFTRTLGAGMAVEWAGTEEIFGVAENRRRFSALAADFTASYAVVSPQLRAPLLPSVTVRAGGSVVRAGAETGLEYYLERQGYTAKAEFSEQAVEVGLAGGVELGFRLSRGTALTFGYDTAVYPWASEGELKLEDPRINLVIGTVEARSYDLRRGGVTVGVSVHFGGQ